VLVSVVAEEETRITRIIKRDGISKADAERRVSAQKPVEFYTENSDFVIKNDSTPAELERGVNSVLKNMLNKQ
jgi:dephospho-CoA kinase